MKKKKHRKGCRLASSFPLYGFKTCPVPLEIVELEDNSYHLIVKAEIDGIQGDMIIDTGASVTVIDQKLFPENQQNKIPVKIQSGSVSGQIEDVQLIQAHHFSIGNYKLKNVRLATIDLEYVNDMYDKHLKRKIIGLLGCDFCVKHKAMIDYRKKELLLHKG